MKHTILVVDDELQVRRAVRRCLEQAGYEVLDAVDGAEALKVMEGIHVDLVLLDVLMPVLDGFETVRRMKSDEVLRGIPIILVTAMLDVEEELKGLDLGVNDYILKPFKSEELIKRVQTWLKRSQLERLQRQREQARTVSQLTVTLSHHINNSLMAMLGRAELTDERDPGQARQLKDVVLRGGKRISTVVQSLQSMASKEQLPLQQYGNSDLSIFSLDQQVEGESHARSSVS